MGLDNGICVRRTAVSESIPELVSFEQGWDKEHRFDFEVCYWRKCYNIRGKILETVDGRFSDEYELALDVDAIDRISDMLKSLSRRNWNAEGGSIWTWDEMEETLGNQIRDLGILKRLMQEHELEVYFYDSY